MVSLIFVEASGEIVWLWNLEFGLLISAITGALLFQRRHPDERAMRIFHDATRNAWSFFIIGLPLMVALINFNLHWDKAMSVKGLFILWNTSFGIFVGTLALKYWK
jgi:hypothetical protein